jgi:hypothetical protein
MDSLTRLKRHERREISVVISECCVPLECHVMVNSEEIIGTTDYLTV